MKRSEGERSAPKRPKESFFLGKNHELPEDVKERLRAEARQGKRPPAREAEPVPVKKRHGGLTAVAVALVLLALVVAAYALWGQ